MQRYVPNNTLRMPQGRLDCHGIKGSQDATRTIDATGTFEAKP